MNPRRYHYLLFSFVIFLYLINLGLNAAIIHYLLAATVIGLYLLSFPYASLLFKILSSIFALLGISFVIIYPIDWQTSFLYVNENLSLLALLFMLPWINSVVRAGRYDRRINQLLSTNVSDLGRLYQRASITSYILVAFINLSALSLSQSVLRKNLRSYETSLQQHFIAQTTLRAFAVALCWSPMEILVAISVDATGVSYFTMLPWLMLVSFLTLTLDGALGRFRYRKMEYVPPAEVSKSNRGITKPILALTLALSLFLTTIVLMGNTLELNFILTVTLVLFPFSLLWSIVIRRWKSFLSVGIPLWKERNNNMQNFILLFVSLALFSTALNQTPLLDTVQAPFLAMEHTPWIVLLMIQLTYLAMSMVGIHPIATIAVLIEAIAPLLEVVNPLSFSIVLVSGALATATVGTYGITVNITAMNTGLNPYRVTWMNMPFALLYGGVGTFIAVLLL